MLDGNRHLKLSHVFFVTVRHLGHNFLTSGDFADISVSKVSAFCSNCRPAEFLCKGLQKKLEMFEVQASLWYLPWCTHLYIHVKCTKPLHKLIVSILVLTSFSSGSTSCSASLNLTQLPISINLELASVLNTSHNSITYKALKVHCRPVLTYRKTHGHTIIRISLFLLESVQMSHDYQ
jgi:hypothetical protein